MERKIINSVGSTLNRNLGFATLVTGLAAVAIITLVYRRTITLPTSGIPQYWSGKVVTFLKELPLTTYFTVKSSPTTQPKNEPTILMGPRELAALTRENLELVANGHYVNSKGEQIALKSVATLTQVTKSYTISSLPAAGIFANHKTTITVVNIDSLSAAKIYVDQGDKVVVLSFASPTEPGGGISDGTMAQEESICYASPELTGFLNSELTSGIFYILKDKYNYASTDHLIHTPNVAICRGSRETNYPLLDNPFRVGIISAAAPCEPQLTEGGQYAKKADETYLRNCIITQLNVVLEEGYDCVILGAFGCGAFRNPPQEVARLYHEVITNHFKGAFKKIVFAVIDDRQGLGPHNPKGNFQPFFDLFH